MKGNLERIDSILPSATFYGIMIVQIPSKETIKMNLYQVWYMKPDFFRDGCMGADWLEQHGKLPTKSNLITTHVMLMEVKSGGHESVFAMMQGENWSPNGEARPLIEEKGLRHTSMSVGDVVVDEDGIAYIVDRFGFVQLRNDDEPPSDLHRTEGPWSGGFAKNH